MSMQIKGMSTKSFAAVSARKCGTETLDQHIGVRIPGGAAKSIQKTYGSHGIPIFQDCAYFCAPGEEFSLSELVSSGSFSSAPWTAKDPELFPKPTADLVKTVGNGNANGIDHVTDDSAG